MQEINIEDFEKVEIRVGKIIEVSDFPKARVPSYKLKIDLGKELGIKQSSAHLTHYSKDELLGRLVLCVVNFRPKNIAGFMSEVLVLGVPDENGKAILVMPEKSVPLGGKLY